MFKKALEDQRKIEEQKQATNNGGWFSKVTGSLSGIYGKVKKIDLSGLLSSM